MTQQSEQWTLLRIEPLTEQDGQDICAWRYEPPYDLYAFPGWEAMLRDGYEFADPRIREEQYAAVRSRDGGLIGFAQFFPLSGVTRLGLGMRPELCGKGLGAAFVRAIVEEARRRKPDDEIDLEVLTWNERARRCYERAGFRVTDTYERGTPTGAAWFHCMVYSAADEE